MTTNGSGLNGKHTTHVSDKGISCQKCHYGYKAAAAHANGTLDTGNPAVIAALFDSTNPSGQWSNDTGPGTGRCLQLQCHGSSALDWYGSGAWTLPSCDTCHNASIGTRRQVTGSGGDFGANPGIRSHHVATSTAGNDPTAEQCKVCHYMSTHMGGIVKLKNADTGNPILYSSSTPSALEAFCLSCHDTDGAISTYYAPDGTATGTDPFHDGKTLGAGLFVAGNKIKGYWNNTYTVHKDKGLTCAGTGEAGTGCHGSNGVVNIHGSVSKGILTKNLTLPAPKSSSDPLPRNPSNPAYVSYINNIFQLCFDCHNDYPAVSKEVVLGYKQGGNYDLSWAPTPYYTLSIQSLFRDVYTYGPKPYDDNFFGDPNTPIHNYHLLSSDGWMQDVWAYRGDAGQTGRASCTTCHNVHGTSGTVRSTYGEFGITAFSDGGNLYKTLVPDTNFDDPVMKSYPIYCNINCHGMAGPSSYWHTPANE